MATYREKRKLILGHGRLSAVPRSLTTKAEIPGISQARFRPDQDIEPFVEAALAALERERATLSSPDDPLPERHFLAISGGGDKGAFAAGLLVGWSQFGTRPEFGVVTGISTGALIAPFAFLGASHDEYIQQMYTTIGPDDIFHSRQLMIDVEVDGEHYQEMHVDGGAVAQVMLVPAALGAVA